MLENNCIMPGAYRITIPETEISHDTWLGALSELQTCQISIIDEPSGNTNNINRKYYPQGPCTASIVQYFRSATWHNHLVDLANLDLEWVRNWGRMHTGFLSKCQFDWTWHSLRAGYNETDWHVDSLKQVIHGLFFMQPDADPQCATVFANDDTGDTDDIVQPSTGIGQGWVILQNGRTYHRGRNLTAHPRFGLKFSYQLWSSATAGENNPQGHRHT